jgi:hypothetical protein
MYIRKVRKGGCFCINLGVPVRNNVLVFAFQRCADEENFRMRGATRTGQQRVIIKNAGADSETCVCVWRRVKNRLALIKCTAMGAVEEKENTRARDSHPPPPPLCASVAKVKMQKQRR